MDSNADKFPDEPLLALFEQVSEQLRKDDEFDYSTILNEILEFDTSEWTSVLIFFTVRMFFLGINKQYVKLLVDRVYADEPAIRSRCMDEDGNRILWQRQKYYRTFEIVDAISVLIEWDTDRPMSETDYSVVTGLFSDYMKGPIAHALIAHNRYRSAVVRNQGIQRFIFDYFQCVSDEDVSSLVLNHPERLNIYPSLALKGLSESEKKKMLNIDIPEEEKDIQF